MLPLTPPTTPPRSFYQYFKTKELRNPRISYISKNSDKGRREYFSKNVWMWFYFFTLLNYSWMAAICQHSQHFKKMLFKGCLRRRQKVRGRILPTLLAILSLSLFKELLKREVLQEDEKYCFNRKGKESQLQLTITGISGIKLSLGWILLKEKSIFPSTIQISPWN